MILALLMSTSVVDAERAFAALAQTRGQWTAFRATAAPDAILFWPKATNAHQALKGLKGPAKAVNWWPTRAWQSCDGTLAVTTGGALWPDGRHGWFTTVWRKQTDGGWKWVLDHGGFTDSPRTQPKTVAVATPPACPKVPLAPSTAPSGLPSEGYSRHEFASADGTLTVTANGFPQGHNVLVRMGDGPVGRQVLLDEVKPRP